MKLLTFLFLSIAALLDSSVFADEVRKALKSVTKINLNFQLKLSDIYFRLNCVTSHFPSPPVPRR